MTCCMSRKWKFYNYVIWESFNTSFLVLMTVFTLSVNKFRLEEVLKRFTPFVELTFVLIWPEF
jgi:hypothetical protein